MGAPDRGRGGFGQTEVANLASLDQVTDRACDVLDRHLGVDAVLVEQVDPVGVQSGQGCVRDPLDLFGAAVQAGRAAVFYSPPELGGGHDLVPDGGEGFAD